MQGVLGPAGGAEAVAQGVVGGRLRRRSPRRGRLDHGADVGLGLVEFLQAGQALGLGQLRLALAGRALGAALISLSSSAIASAWSPLLGRRRLPRRTAARSALWGSFASSAIVFSTAGVVPLLELEPRQDSRAPRRRGGCWGSALTKASSRATASAALPGSARARSAAHVGLALNGGLLDERLRRGLAGRLLVEVGRLGELARRLPRLGQRHARRLAVVADRGDLVGRHVMVLRRA